MMTFEEKVKRMNSDLNEKRSYSVEEVQKILSIRRQSVYKLIYQGCFKAVKLSRGYRIVKSSFDEWLDNEQGGNTDGNNN